MRHCLIKNWSGLRNWYRHQPLDHIRDYMGIKIGLYFAWLGFYTYMLLIASVASLVAIVVPLGMFGRDPLIQEICSSEHVMCPRCDLHCDYTPLEESCTLSKIVDIFDNLAMVVFSFFMSLWCEFSASSLYS